MQLLREFILLDGNEKSIGTFVTVSRKQFFIAQQSLENMILDENVPQKWFCSKSAYYHEKAWYTVNSTTKSSILHCFSIDFLRIFEKNHIFWFLNKNYVF